MERVRTLILKLQQQLNDNSTADQLISTVQMLYAELNVSRLPGGASGNGKVSVLMPFMPGINTGNVRAESVPEAPPSEAEHKVFEVLQVDEKEIEEELEEIKRNAEAKNTMSMNAKPALLFDPIEDVPTLTHQTPFLSSGNRYEAVPASPESINDKLKENKTELFEKLKEEPIKDLKKGIGVNDRFTFINELFRGDEAMYERSIKTINNFSILAEAEYWIKRELKIKIGWTDSDPYVKQFDQLVRRRFS